MKNSLLFILICMLPFGGCVERYDFNVENKTEGIVIEAQISNISFTESKNFPSDGRYFKVLLSKTSDVINIRGEHISNASVWLENDNGGAWPYFEIHPGEYILNAPYFKAMPDVGYQLNIVLATGEQFESSIEKLPVPETQLKEISYEELTYQKYVYIKPNERELRTYDGIKASITVPENDNKEPIYYRWSFEPLWVYNAPQASSSSGRKYCWVTSRYYLNNFVLLKDNAGNYPQELFTVQTTDHDRIQEYFSVLVLQSVLSQGYYYFWEDFQEQQNKGGLYDQAPFSLPTNFKAVNNDWTVNGYFGVVTENATRWVFDKSDLSYHVPDNIVRLCNISYGPPAGADKCRDCLEYTPGEPTNIPPGWW